MKIHLWIFVCFTAYVHFRLISKNPALQWRILIGSGDILLKNITYNDIHATIIRFMSTICSTSTAICRVCNEKNECYRFSGIASQRVKWVDPNIEQVKREAPSPSFSQEKQKELK